MVIIARSCADHVVSILSKYIPIDQTNLHDTPLKHQTWVFAQVSTCRGPSTSREIRLSRLSCPTVMRPLRSLASLRRPQLASRIAFDQKRQFHPTRQAPIAAEVIGVAAGYLHGVHSLTGLPWVCSIPLCAALVRVVVATPLQIYSKIQARREQAVRPLYQSWDIHHRKQSGKRWLPYPHAPLSIDAQREIRNAAERDKLGVRKAIGPVPYWSYINFLQLPIWITVMEGVKDICGHESSLLRFILSLFNGWSAEGALNALPMSVEPSLANEGALWFRNLLAADPLHILPVVLSATIFYNIRRGWKAPPLKDLADLPWPMMVQRGSGTVLKNVLSGFVLWLGYAVFPGMPAALLVYWISSTNVASLQTALLDKYVLNRVPFRPLPRIDVVAKRHLRNTKGK